MPHFVLGGEVLERDHGERRFLRRLVGHLLVGGVCAGAEKFHGRHVVLLDVKVESEVLFL